MRRWVVAAAALAALVMLLSGDTPWRYTLFGLFSPPDLAQDLAAARVFASNQNPYEVGIARAHAELMKYSEAEGYQHFPHPPLLFLLFLPIAELTLRQAAAVWFGLSLGLFLLATLLAEWCIRAGARSAPYDAFDGADRVRRASRLAAGSLQRRQRAMVDTRCAPRGDVLAFPHQRSAPVGRCQYRPRRRRQAVSRTPRLLPSRAAPRAIVWMVVVVVGALGLPLLWMGPDTIRAFVQQAQANVTYWETFPAVTYSIHGVLARLMVGGEWARPLFHAPLLARVLGVLSAVSLIVVATTALRRQSGTAKGEGARFAAWVALLVILNPLAMAHTGVILALPIILIAQELSADHRLWPKLAWMAGVVLVSIPGHTLIFLASMPIEPWQGVPVIALPLWGTLALFSAAIAASSPSAPCPYPLRSIAHLLSQT